MSGKNIILFFILVYLLGNSFAISIYGDFYKNRELINSDISRYPAAPKDGKKMVIITGKKYQVEARRFASWKNQMGIFTTLFEYPSDSVGDNLAGIKKFIKNQYKNGVTYFLLVGDFEDIPSIPYSGGVSDPSFVLLEGGDNNADAYIGRLSVESSEQAAIVVNKIIKYEKEPDPNGSWYHKAMGLADIGGIVSMDEMRTTLLASTYTGVDRLVGAAANKSDIFSIINEGRGWAAYIGHGSENQWVTTGFNNSDVKKLRNSNKLPVIISLACQNGHFNGRTCFAEEWLRAGTDSVGYGAVLFLGSSINLLADAPQIAQKEMVRILALNKSLSIASIIVAGENKMMSESYSVSAYKSWTLFGDPSLTVFTDTPKKLDVTVPVNIDGDNFNLTINVTDSIIGRVGIYSPQRDTLIASEIFDNEDQKAFNLIDLLKSDIDSLLVTVTAINRVPFIAKVNVASTFVNKIKNGHNIMNNIIELGILNNRLKLNVPVSGVYTVGIYTVNGKLISRLNSILTQGINTVLLGESFLANTCVIVNVQSKNLNISQKAIVK